MAIEKIMKDAEIKRLREALKPFAEYGKVLHGQLSRDDKAILELFDIQITVRDLRNAADAYEGEKNDV